ncbi:hypothetical protein GIS00_14960 [Nakamurella sp. YIM 132087]|uniref:Uncharacterized protein n=1 Tax=Nakamurella alba TaxID=2665158 RepID=A0A7K1FME2_9ACTN|nr:hypothetical protein [Nakamurella alba]MTD15240.1 hypothetical protein [Nakamurella alba]
MSENDSPAGAEQKAAKTEDYVGVPVSDAELGEVWTTDGAVEGGSASGAPVDDGAAAGEVAAGGDGAGDPGEPVDPQESSTAEIVTDTAPAPAETPTAEGEVDPDTPTQEGEEGTAADTAEETGGPTDDPEPSEPTG